MIKAVLFDYGGVLSPNGGADSFLHDVAAALGISRDEIHISDIHVQFRKGLLTIKEYLNALHERYPEHNKVTEDVFLENSGLLVRNEAVYDLAAKLREHGIKTGILSDVYDPTARMLYRHGNYDGFDPVVLSCYEHMVKPDPGIYLAAIHELDVRPSEIVFIDDQHVCMHGAELVGMRTIQATSPEQVVGDMQRMIRDENGIEL